MLALKNYLYPDKGREFIHIFLTFGFGNISFGGILDNLQGIFIQCGK